MTHPSPEQFAALARSSPWRWRTLRFVVSWRGQFPTWPRPVRAWVRRPDGIRVEELSGDVIIADKLDHPCGEALRQVHGQWVPVPQPEPYGPLDERAPAPELNGAGLVLRRPRESPLLRYDDPMFQDYRWAAMLDPAELADGEPVETDDAAPAPVTISRLAEVEHHARAAWEAVLQPTSAYFPRCSCCELLFSAESENARIANGEPTVRDRDPDVVYPEGHRVRLDVATGVCVLTEELGGSRPGSGHDLRIEVVGEPVDDDLLTAQRPRPWRRRSASVRGQSFPGLWSGESADDRR